MRVTGDWITHPATQSVCQALTDAGHQALFVGGCVRNALLTVPVADIDIATDATPQAVMNLAQNAGLKAIPTGIDHGTITIVADRIPHEVTTFRRDVETDGRHARVAFTDAVEEDASRRDFTMNALYARADGQVVDPLGGLSDLRARKLRFIKDADARIKEDYLRILRFFRFHAWYGDPSEGLDADGLSACATNSAGLETLSKERIGAEICKLLSAPDPAPAVASMAITGCLSRVLPGSDPTALPLLVDFEQTTGLDPDPMRRLSVIGGQNAPDNLRLSKAQSHHLDTIRTALGDPSTPPELGYRHGAPVAMDIILARAAMFEQHPAADIKTEVERGANAMFPIKSADLSARIQGPALGDALRKLERVWIASDFTKTRDDLLASLA